MLTNNPTPASSLTAVANGGYWATKTIKLATGSSDTAEFIESGTLNGTAANTTGNVPLNTPRDSGNIWTTYTIKDTYELGGGMFYVGQRYANNQNTVTVPAYTRFDLTAAYKQPKYDVRLNVYNLFDTMYYDGIIASDGGRAVPGAGITAMLTLNYRL